jgi:PAS domain S-box-containing protein
MPDCVQLESSIAAGVESARANMANLAGRLSFHEMTDVIGQIRSAFEVFDSQSLLLKRAYDRIRQDLASINRELSERNRDLSRKVLELEEMSGRLQCVIESLTDSVMVVNCELRIERCNRAAELLLGAARDDIIGREYAAVAKWFGDAGSISKVIESGIAVVDNERVRGTGAFERIVSASVAPIRSPAGVVLGAVEVLKDVTDLRKLEARVQLQNRMTALGQMAASVAHEIRNPLGTIEGFASLLRRDLEGMPEHKRLASKIVEGAQNLNYVITNLLEYTRPAFLQVVPCSAAKVVRDAAEVIAEKAQKAGVTLSIGQTDATVAGDERQLKQVLINLVLNAVEACRPGGQVEVGARSESGVCFFSVRDNGTGMTDSELKQVFDPFFTKKAGGTGLGLALCHKIISAHGGEIRVESEEGKGTLFEVVLKESGGQK